ncbi:MAG TPA: ribonuclease HII [Candidatus Saccharimonadales bacterium]|nr:ribonuclease HII [Candidatus Saccharimonadales bacterium]
MIRVIGIDEVGRGSWAGPLLIVAAQARLNLPVGLKDSKLLSRNQRTRLFDQIKTTCQIGEGWVSSTEVDERGLTLAMRLGVKRALAKLQAQPDSKIIIDGHINYCPREYINVEAVVDADVFHPIVSAASIYAKVLRDQHMYDQAKLFPNYGFDQHVGYGTQLHLERLKQFGPCVIHRLSYKPIKALTYD